MSEKALKFDNVEVNKEKFHVSKQPIVLHSLPLNKIVVSDKFKHSDKGFKYFIGYKENNIVTALCIIIASNQWIHKIF